MTEQALRNSRRAGWSDKETDMLWETADEAHKAGLPLKAVFESIAEKTGRRPNSIRNYYYACLHQQPDTQLHRSSPFMTFTPEETHELLRQVLTAQQVQSMTVDEINAAIRSAMEYDEYRYQLENNILITEPNRAEGLHKVLYQCPHCGIEFQMGSQGAELFCKHCGKRWYLQENGQLMATEGETEFSHIPHWFEWEREQVRGQILRGEYRYEDEVDVYSFPRCYRFIPLGKAKVCHSFQDGFTIDGHYRGQDYHIHRPPKSMNSLHVEYDFHRFRKENCFDISTETDSFYCYPTNPDMVTKLAFATEEIYKLHLPAKAYPH